jgi:hypothetical protein
MYSLSPELRENQQALLGLEAHLAKALQPNPDDRPASVREFWDAIDPLLRSASETSVPPPVPIPLIAKPKPRESVNPTLDSFSGRYTFRTVGALSCQRRASTRDHRDGRPAAFALGALGVYRWAGSTWSLLPAPPARPRRPRGHRDLA